MTRRLRTARTRLVRSWQNVSPWLRAACLAMWAGAAVVTAVGVAGDLTGWWMRLPFLTNVASSLAGALFGVPFALLVLQRVAATERERYSQREAQRFARVAAAAVAAEVQRLVPAPAQLADLASQLRRLGGALADAGRPDAGQFTAMLTDWLGVRLACSAALPDAQTARVILRGAVAQARTLRHELVQRPVRGAAAWTPRDSIEQVVRLLTVALRELGGRSDAGELADTVAAALAATSGRWASPAAGEQEGLLVTLEEDVEEMLRLVRLSARLRDAVGELTARLQALP